MQIHSQEEPPFIDQLGFGVAPGFQTFVSCQQQRVSGGAAGAQPTLGLGRSQRSRGHPGGLSRAIPCRTAGTAPPEQQLCRGVGQPHAGTGRPPLRAPVPGTGSAAGAASSPRSQTPKFRCLEWASPCAPALAAWAAGSAVAAAAAVGPRPSAPCRAPPPLCQARSPHWPRHSPIGCLEEGEGLCRPPSPGTSGSCLVPAGAMCQPFPSPFPPAAALGGGDTVPDTILCAR